MSHTQKIGNLGEDVACMFLVKHGCSVIDRNYRKKWGEIDIIARKSGILHFIEVKTVSRENIEEMGENVSRVTDEHRPEDNVHPWKLRRLSRAIQTYLLEKDIEDEWIFDVVTVHLDVKRKKAKVNILENVVL